MCLAIAAAATVSVLAACSSSGGTTNSTNPPSGGASSAQSAGASSSGGSGVDPIAAQRVSAFTAHPAALAETQPVKVAKGLTIAYLQCVQTVCVEIGNGLQEAADAIGAKLLRITHQDTASTVQQAAVNGLQQKPDLLIFSGDPTQWITAQLAQAKAQHIPVVAWSEPGGFSGNGLDANLINGDDYYFLGVLEADWVASHHGAGSHSLLLNVPSYPVLQTAGQGYKEELKRVCPTCKVTEQDFTIPDVVAGKVAPGAVAALQRDPKIVEIVGTFGGLITQQLAQAVKNAGHTKVKAISASGTSANYQLIQQGQLEEADVALPSSFLAWRAIDTGLRLIAGQKVQVSSPNSKLTTISGHPNIGVGGVPQEFVTKAQMPSSTVKSVDQLWSPTKNFQGAFKKLWGVG